MKIIQNGTQRIFREECRKCHTIYEYDGNDYFVLEEDKPSGCRKVETHLFRKDEEYREICRYKWKALRCPVCGDIKKRMDAETLFRPRHAKWEKIK